jgi:hypothetical protein
MARTYNGFSSYRRFAGGYQSAAGFCAGFADAVSRGFARLWPNSNDVRGSEYRLSRQSVSGRLPGSLFDARYDGLTADAARLDAAICRRRELHQARREATGSH